MSENKHVHCITCDERLDNLISGDISVINGQYVCICKKCKTKLHINITPYSVKLSVYKEK